MDHDGSMPSDDAAAAAVVVLRDALADLDLDWRETEPGLFLVTLHGERKLSTECAIQVGQHYVSVRAFVARHPDENAEGVYAWALQRNLKLALVCFAVDALGDIYLVGRVPSATLTADVVDQLLGIVADTADASFNTILELGFASGIAAEWVWRRSRGLSTANLAAFTHLDPDAGDPDLHDPAPDGTVADDSAQTTT